MQLELGQVFGGKYRILRLLGEGGMGAVYEGENVRIHRRVAIKTLHSGIAAKSDVVARFEREAQAAGRIGSEHIVEVLDLGELPDGSRYMVMEFCEGMTLSDRIKSRGRLLPNEASAIVIQLLEGLGAAHATGIIHRDLKPANVFLLHSKQGKPDFVKILDFGVSKFNVLGGDGDEMSMTRTGAVVGTPYYMSPEQAQGAQVDPRSDLYAVGVILYECITGQVPFSAETFNELLFRIVLESPPPIESYVPDLDPAFAVIVRHAMAREANERFQTTQDFQRALAEYIARSGGQHAYAGENQSARPLPAPKAPPPRGSGPQPLPAFPLPGGGLGLGGTMMMEASPMTARLPEAASLQPQHPMQMMPPQQPMQMMQPEQPQAFGAYGQDAGPYAQSPAYPQAMPPMPIAAGATDDALSRPHPPMANRGGLIVVVAAVAIVALGVGGIAFLRLRGAASTTSAPVAADSPAASPSAGVSVSASAPLSTASAPASSAASAPAPAPAAASGDVEPSVTDPSSPSAAAAAGAGTGGVVATHQARPAAGTGARVSPIGAAPKPASDPKPATDSKQAKPVGRKLSSDL